MGFFDVIYKRPPNNSQAEEKTFRFDTRAAEAYSRGLPFLITQEETGLALDAWIHFSGTAGYVVTDQGKYDWSLAGNEETDARLARDLISAAQMVLFRHRSEFVNLSDIKDRTDILLPLLQERLAGTWGGSLGIALTSIAIDEVTADPETLELLERVKKMTELKKQLDQQSGGGTK